MRPEGHLIAPPLTTGLCASCGGPDHGAMCILPDASLCVDPVRLRQVRCPQCATRFWMHRRGRPSRFCGEPCRRAFHADTKAAELARWRAVG